VLYNYIRNLVTFLLSFFKKSTVGHIRCDNSSSVNLTEEEQLFASDIGVRIVQDIIIGSISGYVIFSTSNMIGQKTIIANPLMTIQDAVRASMYTKFADKETLNAIMNDFKSAKDNDQDDDPQEWWKKHSGGT